ncbi:unnamed protein product, partial [Protopolystoma xenopodis]
HPSPGSRYVLQSVRYRISTKQLATLCEGTSIEVGHAATRALLPETSLQIKPTSRKRDISIWFGANVVTKRRFSWLCYATDLSASFTNPQRGNFQSQANRVPVLSLRASGNCGQSLMISHITHKSEGGSA